MEAEADINVVPPSLDGAVVVAKSKVRLECSRCENTAYGVFARLCPEDGEVVVTTTGFIYLSQSTQRLFRQNEVVLCTACAEGG